MNDAMESDHFQREGTSFFLTGGEDFPANFGERRNNVSKLLIGFIINMYMMRHARRPHGGGCGITPPMIFFFF